MASVSGRNEASHDQKDRSVVPRKRRTIVSMAFSSPKNPWALHARGRTLNGRGLGPQNPMCWRARILRVPKEPLFDELGGLFTGTVVTSGRKSPSVPVVSRGLGVGFGLGVGRAEVGMNLPNSTPKRGFFCDLN